MYVSNRGVRIDICREVAGYSSGVGIWRGLGNGLVGVVGLPVSGALGFVSAVSTGLARATGTYHFSSIPGSRL